MIALIPGLTDTLAFLQPEVRAPQKSFSQVLDTVQAQSPSPTPAPPPQYVVQGGDHLWGIAKKLGYDPRELARVNNLKDPDRLKVGQVLILPEKTRSSQTGTETARPSWTSSQDGTRVSDRAIMPQSSARITAGPAHQSKAKTTTQSSPHRSALVVASWYGANHHGQRMANGQPFDMQADTVAHPSLPLGTLIKLTNPKNGHTVMAQVTDRGPFVDGRHLDVSYGVAKKLGVVRQGVARLLMEES